MHLIGKPFYQEIQSSVKLEINGHKSCDEKSRHIHIIYFFIKDVLKREKIELIYCPTVMMVANYYTNPLQESLFRKTRGIVMEINPFPDEERVGSSKDVSKISSGINSNTEKILTTKSKKSVTYADVVMIQRVRT